MSSEKEIEIKLLFKDKNAVISTLGKNIKFQKTDSIRDIYFGKENQGMPNSNNLMRIRSDKNEMAELTYKGKAKER